MVYKSKKISISIAEIQIEMINQIIDYYIREKNIILNKTTLFDTMLLKEYNQTVNKGYEEE